MLNMANVNVDYLFIKALSFFLSNLFESKLSSGRTENDELSEFKSLACNWGKSSLLMLLSSLLFCHYNYWHQVCEQKLNQLYSLIFSIIRICSKWFFFSCENFTFLLRILAESDGATDRAKVFRVVISTNMTMEMLDAWTFGIHLTY